MIGVFPLLLALLRTQAGGVEIHSRIASVLHRGNAEQPRDAATLAQALARLGPDAVPALYDLIRGQGMEELIGEEWKPEVWSCTPEDIPELCIAALARASAKEVLGHLDHVLEGEPSFQERIAILRILERQPSVEGLALLLENARGLGDLELARPSVRRTLRSALTATLRVDEPSWSRLGAELSELPTALAEVSVEAIGAAGRARGMQLLARIFAQGTRGPVRSELVVEAMVELERSRPWDLGGETYRRCGAWQRSPEPARRMRFARLVGELHAADGVPGLLELLKDENLLVRGCAESALVAMKGSPLDLASWEVWYENEQAWQATRWVPLCEDFASGEAGRANQALRELREHPLYRHEVARALARGLASLPPGLLPAVSAELTALGSRCAVPDLVAALEGKAQLRAAAWRVLRALMGDEGRELAPKAWRALLDT
jgi:hypothetical protein